MAVFFTAAVISGVLRMKYPPLMVRNFVAAAVYVLSRSGLPPTAGRVSAGEQDGVRLSAP